MKSLYKYDIDVRDMFDISVDKYEIILDEKKRISDREYCRETID